MTPFDERACLAMLLAFYPIVSPAALVQARAERPEYFAGARLIGHSGDKIELPDGRIFDCIFAVDGPAAGRRWQMIEALPGGASELFPLEPGPLVPLDEPSDAPAPPGTAFEQIVAGAIEQLGGSEGVLDAAAVTVSEAANNAVYHDAGGAELDDVEQVIGEVDASRGAEALADVVGQVAGVAGAIDDTDHAYDDAPPDLQIPQEPATPEWPADGGVEPGPGPGPGPQPHDT